jgi:hypothetical protein
MNKVGEVLRFVAGATALAAAAVAGTPTEQALAAQAGCTSVWTSCGRVDKPHVPTNCLVWRLDVDGNKLDCIEWAYTENFTTYYVP